MNRPPSSDDSNPPSLHSQWTTTSPSKFFDEPIRPRRVPAVPHPRRKPQLPALVASSHVWLSRLPPQVQPLATARRHPHVINNLSALWGSPAEVKAYLGELMLSSRPGREGFAFEVISELADLQSFLDEQPGAGRF
jgi:hypothetical protein